MLLQRNVRLSPGHDNLVALSAVSVRAAQRIQSVPASVRNCYFSGEHHLRLHSYYTQAGCLLECRLNYTRDTLLRESNFSCVPW